MQDSRAYPESCGPITHIETHISHVLLTGNYAYKIKKPLRLEFLDFSTLEKRRFFCEEELRLNRRLAPELYLDVVPICGSVDSPQVSAPGTPIEYAVKMVQFDRQSTLDRVDERGELTVAHIDQMARVIADFHGALAPAAASSPYGRPEGVIAPVVQNFHELDQLLESAHDKELLASLSRWTERQSERLLPVLAHRRAEGWIRECHGDLHLANMVLVNDRVRVFDCLEFDPHLRWCDVMAEIAFVVMDFIQRGRDTFAYRLLNRYLDITGDYDGVRVLRYYVVYRALVRAKVAALRAEQLTLDAPTAAALRADCSAYIRTAGRFTDVSRPALVILHGLSGSGKTTQSQPLVEQGGMIRLRSDVERKRMHGLAPMARTGSAPGAGLYLDNATEATYARLEQLSRLVLEGCFSVVVDATFIQRRQRDRFRAAAVQADAHFAIVSFRASEPTLHERVAQRAERRSDASEAGIEVLRYQLEIQEPLMADELAYAFVLDTDELDSTQVADKFQPIMRTIGVVHDNSSSILGK